MGSPADCLPSGTVGQWLPAPCNGGPCTRAATLEPSFRRRGRLGPRAGIPKRKRPNCHSKEDSQNSVGGISAKGEGPKNPGVAAPLASAGCRGNRLPNASCVEVRWYDMGGRSHTSAFSSHYWTSPSRAILSGSFDTADSASLQRTDGREQCEWWYFVELTYHLRISRTIPLSHRQPFSVGFPFPDRFG